MIVDRLIVVEVELEYGDLLVLVRLPAVVGTPEDRDSMLEIISEDVEAVAEASLLVEDPEAELAEDPDDEAEDEDEADSADDEAAVELDSTTEAEVDVVSTTAELDCAITENGLAKRAAAMAVE